MEVKDFGPHRDVSRRFRNLVETIEPGIHQFIPTKFILPDGSEIERYWWQICRLLDTIDGKQSNSGKGEYNVTVVDANGRNFGAKERRPQFLLFRRKAIGEAHFWIELTAVQKKNFCSALVREKVRDADITGILFYGYHDDGDVY